MTEMGMACIACLSTGALSAGAILLKLSPEAATAAVVSAHGGYVHRERGLCSFVTRHLSLGLSHSAPLPPGSGERLEVRCHVFVRAILY